MSGCLHMGCGKKNMKQKLFQVSYRKRGLNRQLIRIKKSLDEVCRALTPKC